MTSTTPQLFTTVAAVRAGVAGHRAAGRTVALVPTMGALHEGHLALVARARELADVVIVSVFVNPLQFGPSEDFEQYPRTLDADLGTLAGHADAVFAPAVAEMYPDGPGRTRVTAGPVGALFEGASRPGHFDGMLTVVAKLFHIVGPDTALFGQKDAQQLFLVRQMVAELNLPLAIEAVPIVREGDGLARSSRNRYLSEAEHTAALALSGALAAASAAAADGVRAIEAAALGRIGQQPTVILDYLGIVDPATFAPVADEHRGDALVLLAARVGATRLIDNQTISIP